MFNPRWATVSSGCAALGQQGPQIHQSLIHDELHVRDGHRETLPAAAYQEWFLYLHIYPVWSTKESILEQQVLFL
jgi:hypothetical protein